MGTTESDTGSAGTDLWDYVRILRRRWLLVVLMTVFGVAAAAVPLALLTPTYEARTQLYVSVRSEAGGTGDLVQGNSFAKEVVSSYTDIVGTSVVLDPVIEELGLNTTAAELSRRVQAGTPDGSVLIDITVSDTDPRQAEKAAAAVSRSLTLAVQNRLEPKRADGQSSISLATTQDARASDSPVSPRAGLLLPAGLLFGLLCGIGIAVLTAFFDTRVRSARDIRALTNHPVIGRIPRDSSVTHDPLVVRSANHGSTAEAFRVLRTNLDFLGVGSRNKVFTITSAGLGEGKSVTAANLSIILAESGLRVALVDCDLRRPKIAEYLGVEGAAGLSDVLVGRVEIADVLQPWGEYGLSVLPAGHIPPNPSELLGSQAMDAVLAELGDNFDYVILDAPPTLAVTDSAVVGKKSSGVIMIAAAGNTKKPSLDESIRTHEAVGVRVAGVVVTMLPANGEDMYSYGAAEAYGTPSADGEQLSTAAGQAQTAGPAPERFSGPQIWPFVRRDFDVDESSESTSGPGIDDSTAEDMPRVGAISGQPTRRRTDEH